MYTNEAVVSSVDSVVYRRHQNKPKNVLLTPLESRNIFFLDLFSDLSLGWFTQEKQESVCLFSPEAAVNQ